MRRGEIDYEEWKVGRVDEARRACHLIGLVGTIDPRLPFEGTRDFVCSSSRLTAGDSAVGFAMEFLRQSERGMSLLLRSRGVVKAP